MALARIDLESLLRARRLDGTLTTALPGANAGPAGECASQPTEIAALDARLDGGFPRGQLSEIVGPRSSGCASLVLRLLGAATSRGERVALVDALDMFDPASAVAAGVECERLLWIRGHVTVHPGLSRDRNRRAMEQAIRAFALVLQAGIFGLAIFDAGEAPPDAWHRLPFTTWLRLQRMIEGGQTAGVVVGGEPRVRSAAGVSLQLERRCARFEGPWLQGLAFDARVVRARARVREDTVVPCLAAVSADV
jgi:hypothetical protein